MKLERDKENKKYSLILTGDVFSLIMDNEQAKQKL